MSCRRHATRSGLGATLVALAISPGLTGCSTDDGGAYYGTTTRPANKDLHTLYVNNGAEPEYLDPGKCNDTASSALVDAMFEGLLHYGPDAEPLPGMALRWDKTDDNRLYRFHLRHDAKWSDGVGVTAKDFEYAWRRVLTPKTGSRAASALYILKNGELFNLGGIKSTTDAVDVVADGLPASAKIARLDKGVAVRVLGRSPRLVTTPFDPLADAPSGVDQIELETGNAKANIPPSMRLGPKDGGKTLTPAADKAWDGRVVSVVKRLAKVQCNGQDDYFWLLDSGGKRGVLPGCALGDAPRDPARSELALVAKWSSLPTFHAPPAAPPPRKTELDAAPDHAGGGSDPFVPVAPPPLDAAPTAAAPAVALPAAAAPTSAAPAAAAPEPTAAAEPEPLGFVPVSSLVSDPSVLGVRATDDYTLEVELENPTPYFLDLCCHSTLSPVRKDVVEPFEERGAADMWTRPENIVVNGPYILATHKFRYELTMKRNPHYYAHDALKIHDIVWLEIEQYTATLQLYKTAEIDWTGQNSALPAEYMPILTPKKDYESVLFLGVYWYEFNVKVPPMNDVRVRRALNLAVDKNQIVTNITRSGQVPATHYVPDITGLGYSDAAKRDRDRGFDPFAGPNADFNPERARQLLGEAGFPVVKDGDGWRCEGIPAIEILYNTSEGHKQIAVAVQDMWKRHLGISATLRNEEWKVMLKNVRDGNFQIVRFGWFADYNHPQTFLDNFLSFSPNNHTKWADSTFDATMKVAAATADPVESMAHYRAAERIAIDGMARLPLYFYTKNSMVKPWVKGFHFNARNEMLAKWMWMDLDWQNNPSDEPAMPLPVAPPPGRY